MMRKQTRFLAALVVVVAPTNVFGDTIVPGLTAEELSALPDLCTGRYAVLGAYPAITRQAMAPKRYANTRGISHHYCNGLVREMRATKSDGSQRTSHLKFALGEYMYELKRLSDTDPRGIQYLLRVGRVYRGLWQDVEAGKIYYRILDIDPENILIKPRHPRT